VPGIESAGKTRTLPLPNGAVKIYDARYRSGGENQRFDIEPFQLPYRQNFNSPLKTLDKPGNAYIIRVQLNKA
jgi:hypothetical protein